jgi:hypothetical protein
MASEDTWTRSGSTPAAWATSRHGQGRLVGGCGADEDELLSPAGEQLDIALNLIRGEGDPVDHGVEDAAARASRVAGRSLMSAVSLLTPSGRERDVGVTTGHHGQIDAGLDRPPRGRCADDSGATDEEDLKGCHGAMTS